MHHTRAFSLLTTGIVLLQCVFFYFGSTSWILSTTEGFFSILFVCAAIGFWRTKLEWLFHLLRYNYFVLLSLFALALVSDEAVTAPPLLQLSLVVLHAFAVLFLLVSLFQAQRSRKILLVSIGLIVIFFSSEMILYLAAGNDTDPLFEEKHWKTVEQLSGELALRRKEALSSKALHDVEHFAGTLWLRTEVQNSAELQYGSDRSVRIGIKTKATGTPHDIQLNLSGLAVRAGEAYTIRFRARADHNRKIYVGFARSREPWDGLGLYSRIEVKPEWEKFEVGFVSKDNESNGRIHFDVGEESIPVEVSSIRISLSSGEKTESYPTYRWDRMGCRGPNYKIPGPAATRRILVLGDDYTFGTGLEEKDTFAAELANRFNQERSGKSYEVINCGMNDHTIRESRKFLEIYGGEYEPEVVLFVMTLRSAVERLEQRIRPRSPSLIVHSLRRITQPAPKPHFIDISQELKLMNRAAQQQNSGFALILFRDDSDYAGITLRGQSWNLLAAMASSALQSLRVPILDLGRNVYVTNSREEMIQPSIPLPNRFAHKQVSGAIYQFLKRHPAMQ
jgi:hypothetical protein